MRVALEHAYKARHGTGATLSGAEALRILSHAADALCGEPIEPELPPAIAAALVGEAWRRQPSGALPDAHEQLALLRELVHERRHEGAAAAVRAGGGPPPPAVEGAALPPELLASVEKEFARRHGSRPLGMADSVAFLDQMLETRCRTAPLAHELQFSCPLDPPLPFRRPSRRQARDELLEATAALPPPPPSQLVLAARQIYQAAHGEPPTNTLAALEALRGALPQQAAALGAAPLPRAALREAVYAANSDHGLHRTAEAAGARYRRAGPTQGEQIQSHISKSARAHRCLCALGAAQPSRTTSRVTRPQPRWRHSLCALGRHSTPPRSGSAWVGWARPLRRTWRRRRWRASCRVHYDWR